MIVRMHLWLYLPDDVDGELAVAPGRVRAGAGELPDAVRRLPNEAHLDGG